MKRLTLSAGIVATLLCFCPASVLAQLAFNVVADENGNATLDGVVSLSSTVAVEPTSGLATLRYTLGFPVIGGDVLLINPVDITPQNPTGISDLIRFEGGVFNYMYFFSLIDDASPPDLADVPVLPVASNPITLLENGPEGSNSAQYNPSLGQPGSVLIGGAAAQYTFLSDVPEPSAALLACAGAAMLVLRRKGRKKGFRGI